MKTPLVFAAIAALLAACSTPQVAMDQANHTVGLVTQLELEMREFDRIQKVAATARLKSIAVQEQDNAFVLGQARIDEKVRRAMGDTETTEAESKFSIVAQAIADDDTQLKTAIASVDAELSALLKPLPSTADNSSAAQKALADMGAELSPTIRFSELQSFYKTVKESVDANRQKIRDAEDAAAK